MTQLARTASLVTALLIASVATAFAECAWVLWWHDIAPVEMWEISQAHPSLKGCTSDLLEVASSLKQNGYRITGSMPGARMVTIAKDSDKKGYLLCLPDTADPRGPKGR